KELGFVVVTKAGHSDTLPPKFVAGTDPNAGTELKPGSTVTLVVVDGPYPVHVPTVVGMQAADAQNQLQAAGFTVQLKQSDDQTQKAGQVLDQSPAAGQGLDSASGVTVTITVAQGPPGIPMPTVLNLGCTDATNQLTAMGLQ